MIHSGEYLMSESFHYRLNNLFEELLAGKYHAVIKKTDEILQNSETIIEERIEAMLAKSWSLYSLNTFELRAEYGKQALEIISEAFQRSLEAENILLMFDTIYLNILAYSLNDKHKSVIEHIETAKEIYEKLEVEYPELSKEKKTYLLSLLALESIHKESVIKDYILDFQESIGYLEEALQIIDEYLEKGTVLTKISTLFTYYRISNLYGPSAKYKKIEEYLKNLLKIAEENKNEYWISSIFQFLGRIYWFRGELDSFLQYTIKSLEMSEKHDNIRGIGHSHYNLGIYFSQIGELKKSLEHAQKAYDILSNDGKNKKTPIVSRIINNMAGCFANIGDYDKALAYYDEAIEINRLLRNDVLLHFILNSKSNILREAGSLNEALKLAKESMQYYRRRGFKRAYCISLWSIASTYQAKGMFDKSLKALSETLQIYDEIGNKTVIALILCSLISLAIEFDKKEMAKVYIKELEQRSEQMVSKIARDRILQAEALILSESFINKDRVQAVLIYEQLLDEQLLYSERLSIIIHLCKLLLSELKISSDERILTKLQKYVDKMIELSTENYIPRIIVESLWFKAQLSLLVLDFNESTNLLTQALDIAEEKGLKILINRIINAKEELIQQQIDLETLEKDSPSISKRMDAIEIENNFKKIQSLGIFQFKQHI